MATSDTAVNVLSVWHERLTHADNNNIRKMAQSSAAQGLKMAEVWSTNCCSACVERTTTNASMSSRTVFRRGLVL